MKKLMSVIAMLIICGGVWADGKFVLTTQADDEISEDIRLEIEEFIVEYIDCLKEDRFDDSLEYISPVLLSANQNYNDVANSLKQMFINNEFYLENEYYSKVIAKDDPIDLTIIPSNKETKLIINRLRIYGKETYNLFFLTNDEMPQYLLYISLGKFENEWKINIIKTALYGFKDANIFELYEDIKIHEENDEMLVAAIYSLSLAKILRPIEYMQYEKEDDYKECISRIIEKVNNSKVFPITLSDLSIFGINIEIINGYGIVPLIMYTTNTELNEKAKAEAELRQKEILEELKGIEDEFQYFILKAYNEIPIDPNKQYKAYSTFIERKGR